MAGPTTTVIDFKTFYETAPVAFLVLAPDRPRFTILAASDAYLRATRTSRAIIGRGIFEVFPDNPGDPASTGGPARASFERVLETAAPDAMAVQKHSLRRPESEGGGFEERYWSPINTPVIGRHGDVVYIHHRVEDVTEFVRQKQHGAEQAAIADELRTRAGEMEADVLRRARELQDLNERLRAANARLEELDRERERRAEERVRDETALLQAISDTSPDVMFAKDRRGRLRYANPAALALIGKPLDAVIGRTDAELLEDADAAKEVMENDRRIMESGAAEEVEERVPLPDGTERVWSSRKVPYRDRAGVIVGLLGVSHDMTERRRVVNALRASEERLRVAHERLRVQVESTPLALVEWDADYRVVAYSGRAQEVFGWGPDEVIGKRIDEIPWVPEEDWPTVRAVMRDMSSGARATNVSANRNVRKDGKVIACEWYNSTLRDDHGRLLAVLSLVLDVTERKRAEEALRAANAKLREADRRKDEFLGMLSHELRNPLAPIRNSTYLLRHATPGTDQARRAREVIERQTEHLTRLVDDLLDVTRIARGKVELRRSRADVREVVLRAAEDFRLTLEDRGVAFRTSLPDTKVWADLDATRITQVVGNLFHNAAKFTRRGDEVSLSVTVDRGDAVVTVSDTGAGIDPKLLPTVFDPFVQGERTLARTEGGLGLGLALVKGIVGLHGGSVRAASAGKGMGAEFVFRIPLAERPDRAAPESPATAGRRHGGRRVLVVDDNRDAAESLADLVRMLGHEADVAYDGPSAVDAAKASRPDVVLCDIGLPGMDGYEVAKALRATVADPMQIVAVSGYAQPEDVKRALDAGFTAHVAKPPDPVEIERMLG